MAAEVARLEALLDERRGELVALQEEFREFKMRYARVVGSRLAELAEVESAIRKAEERLLSGGEAEDHDAESDAHAPDVPDALPVAPLKTSMRKLFWSVARLFHPDHAADEGEARRRHTIMAEASRAYREGDVESLHILLGDEELQSYCATAPDAGDAPQDLAGRLVRLKEEVLTVEFGLKRIRQDSLHRLMLSVADDAAHGRDGLSAMAERIARQITKARHRLENLA